MYKKGTLEEYLIDNPVPLSESGLLQKRKWKNPDKDNEYLWGNVKGTINEKEKFDIVSTWNKSIIKPTSIKYYISKNETGHCSGVVEIGQCMFSNSESIEIFDSEEEYLKRCEKLGVLVDKEV